MPAAAMQSLRQAMAAHQAGNLAEAENLYRRVLDVDANHLHSLVMLGILQVQLGRHADAEELLRRASELNPGDPRIQFNYGNVLLAVQRVDEAIAIFQKVLTLDPSMAEAQLNLGNILIARKRFEEAIACFDAAIRLNGNYADAHCNRAHALEEVQRFDEALASSEAAIRINPRNADFQATHGNILHRLARDEEALSALSTALALNPRVAAFHFNYGNILFERKRFSEAAKAYTNALALDPTQQYAEGARLHAKMQICDWRNFNEERAHFISSVQSGVVSQPFVLLSVSDSAGLQRECAEVLSRTQYAASVQPRAWRRRTDHERIRVAYLSGDFGQHALTTLLAGVFEEHDRTRFETYALSFEPHGASEMHTRLKNAFDQFIDVKGRSDADVAQLLRTLEIDIAVDLTGYTRRSRTGIFALRPCPIQINYLGYPGTMGSDDFDYIVADHFVVPENASQFYSEHIIYLPDTFQGNDGKRAISDKPVVRSDVGLPEESFVFCSFNNSYKITPAWFDVWMRLLRKVDRSVLWVLGDDKELETNLRRETGSRDVDPGRVIFAPRIPYADYLARFRLADLFLDTFPFNAGSTASDVLWGGLPIITRAGDAFASRMAGSLLTAVGIPELVTKSAEEYENLATQLATNPERMASIRKELAAKRISAPLFDTHSFTRKLERAYKVAFERYRRGLVASDIDLKQ